MKPFTPPASSPEAHSKNNVAKSKRIHKKKKPN